MSAHPTALHPTILRVTHVGGDDEQRLVSLSLARWADQIVAEQHAATLAVARAPEAALTEFRERCAPMVGPVVVCRGRVICSPRPVPVDPVAYQRAKIRDTAATLTQVAHQVRAQYVAAWATIRPALARLAADVQAAFAPLTQDDVALVDGVHHQEDQA